MRSLFKPPLLKMVLMPAFALIFCCSLCFGQGNLLRDTLLNIQNATENAIKTRPAEKLYMQFDKPYYAIGDTIWFKAYLLNAPTLFFSAKSGLLHIDITTDSGKLVKRFLIPLKNGTGWSNINIDSAVFKTGHYTLHAYTNWMRNFGGDVFFTKHLILAGPSITIG